MYDLERSWILGLHPAHQHLFELFGINLFQQPPEGSLRGHVILPSSPPARATAQVATLPVIEALSKFGNGMRSFAAGRHRQSDEGQQTSQLVAHSSGIARIGHSL